MNYSRIWASNENHQAHIPIQERRQACAKRGKDFDVFRDVVANLAAVQPLDPKFRDHSLVGQYAGTRECHIEPDWLLIYESTDDEIVLIRTGSHADLFK